MTPLYHAIWHADDVAAMRVLIEYGADVNQGNDSNTTPLHQAVMFGHTAAVKLLIQSGANVNALTKYKRSPLQYAASEGKVQLMLRLLCFGAEINEMAIEEMCEDRTKLLRRIHRGLSLLRAGERIRTTLMSYEEKRFMWNLAFFFTIAYRGAAFKAYYAIRSCITYHGIFMGCGYDLGDGSVWRREDVESDDEEEEDYYDYSDEEEDMCW